MAKEKTKVEKTEDKVKSSTDQRSFIIVYNDFWQSDLLDVYEKAVFITLKKFADNKSMQAFPSLKTISRLTHISVSKVQQCLKTMQDLKIITVEHRVDDIKGHQSNLYTIHDYASIWGASSVEEVQEAVSKAQEEQLVEKLRALGYEVTKVEEKKKEQPKKENKREVKESVHIGFKEDGYSLDFIKELYCYDVMIERLPSERKLIDSVMNILYSTINTTKQTVRVCGEDKPVEVVRSKLLKLEMYEILYCIETYSNQTSKIRNSTSYILTLLYRASEQYELDITNQVSHDMHDF